MATENLARSGAPAKLNALGQSLWLDNITRDLLNNGTLAHYIGSGLSVTGLTSNPTIFDHAISKSSSYDADVGSLGRKGLSTEDLFFELAIADLTRAADLFKPIYERSATVDGWVSLEVSPLLAYDTAQTLAAARMLHTKAGRPNLFIKIPGTREGLPAIEEAIFQGIPINVTLLFSTQQYQAAAEAYLRGLERRVLAGLSPDVRSVASLFVSRWDKATMERLPAQLRNTLGIAVGQQSFRAYRQLMATDRWQRLMNLGARPQRLLFASTGVKDPSAPDTMYITALAAPNTVNTMPEETLLAFGGHGSLKGALAADGGSCEQALAAISGAGVDLSALAAQLQSEGAESFNASWKNLLKSIETKSKALK
jgi:transaldolase